MPRQRIVTILTDFGTADGYVASMKGVILSIAPSATLVDVAHDVPAGDVLAAAFVLRQALPLFPPETVHCVVVDPTVGTDRRILAARYARQHVVFPDNGVITFVNDDQPLERIVVLRDERHFLGSPVSSTFHGRDIFAPVAAHLANGLAMERLGPAPETFKLLDLPAPRRGEDGSLVGQVIHVDHFGNLITNVPATMLPAAWPQREQVEVVLAGRSVGPLRPAYAFVGPGEPLALINSMDRLEVAVNAGRACDALAAGVGAEVRVLPAKAR